MRKGTRSLLFGDHHFLLHPLFLARAWWKLFGFPKSFKLWVCFFIHDLGYWGKPNMDGEEGRTHPELGANIAHWLFDKQGDVTYWSIYPPIWYEFCLFHSRYYAKKAEHPVSALALADKMAIVITPWWIFLPLAWLCGTLPEYRYNAESGGESTVNVRTWHKSFQDKTYKWLFNTFNQPHPMHGYYNSWENGNGKVSAVEAPEKGTVATVS